MSSALLANTYYLSPSGDDANSGLSISSAWKTIQKLNTINLLPDDSVLFEGGSSFTGNIYLDVNDAGTPMQPVFIGSYGNGRATIFGGNSIGILAYNCAGLHISNLQITGGGATTDTTSGIGFYMDAQADLSFIQIDSCDISGFGDYGIELAAVNTNFGYVDVNVNYVNSFSNGNGGMISYGFHDVINNKNFHIAHCSFHDNKGRADVTNIHTGNGIVLSGVENAVIEYCDAYNNGELNTNPSGGPVGIWFYLVKNGTIQFCESHHNNTASIDGGGFDIDGGSQDCIIQYCYSHDNAGPGYLMAEYGAGIAYTGNTIRYNISQNDARKGFTGAITFWGVDNSHRINQSQVYNNTVFLDSINTSGGTPAAVRLIGGNFSGVKLANNIFYTSGVNMLNADVAVDSAALHFLANDYYATNGQPAFLWGSNTYNSLAAWKADASTQERRGTFQYGIEGDPLLTSPGGAGTVGIGQLQQLSDYLSAYRLRQSSPALDAGIDMNLNFGSSIGTRDLFGNAPYYGPSQDIGAHECNACYSILPLQIIQLHARKQDNGVKITWRVSDQSLVESYILEASNNGIDFSKMRTVKANIQVQEYTVYDGSYFARQRFYRLQLIQRNGAHIYSRIVIVDKDAQPGFDLRFSAIGPSIIFNSDVQRPVLLHLYNPEGSLVLSGMHLATQGESRYNLNLHLPAGVYILSARDSQGVSRTLRVVIK